MASKSFQIVVERLTDARQVALSVGQTDSYLVAWRDPDTGDFKTSASIDPAALPDILAAVIKAVPADKLSDLFGVIAKAAVGKFG